MPRRILTSVPGSLPGLQILSDEESLLTPFLGRSEFVESVGKRDLSLQDKIEIDNVVCLPDWCRDARAGKTRKAGRYAQQAHTRRYKAADIAVRERVDEPRVQQTSVENRQRRGLGREQ